MSFKPPFLRSAFNYDMFEASKESALFCPEPGKTKQSFKDECDINVIVERFGLTGQLPEGVVAPVYGDYTDVFDFHSAANAMAVAHEAFDLMPANVRARFNHDPGAFVDFCSDESNRSEAEKLGLIFPSRPDGQIPSRAASEAAAGGVPPGPGEKPA